MRATRLGTRAATSTIAIGAIKAAAGTNRISSKAGLNALGAGAGGAFACVPLATIIPSQQGVDAVGRDRRAGDESGSDGGGALTDRPCALQMGQSALLQPSLLALQRHVRALRSGEAEAVRTAIGADGVEQQGQA